MNSNALLRGSKLLTIFLCCYGDFPHYSLRALESLVHEPQLKDLCDLHVGCNDCGATTVSALRQQFDAGIIDTLLESRTNLNKSPMMRLVLDIAATPYFLVMDDDSHLRTGWLSAMAQFIEENTPFDAAGSLCVMHRYDAYQDALRRRPWFRGEEFIPASQQKTIVFPTGGLYLARAAFLRQHNFPDRGMVKRHDDALLGDLISQINGTMLPFSEEIWRYITINDGQRRGNGEGDDGWRHEENLLTAL